MYCSYRFQRDSAFSLLQLVLTPNSFFEAGSNNPYYYPIGDLMREEIDKKENKDTCTMNERDFQEDPSLCCCYSVDSDGIYVDPCYRPVSGCC